MSLLSARHLPKKYGARAVVRDVSIDVNSGEVVGLLGPNGAGKTTSFYMIIGLVACDGGGSGAEDEDSDEESPLPPPAVEEVASESLDESIKSGAEQWDDEEQE